MSSLLIQCNHLTLPHIGIGFVSETSKQGFSMIFASNYLGHFHLTRLLLDLLVKSQPARIVNVVSPMYLAADLNYKRAFPESNAYPNVSNYGFSKLAGILHIRQLATVLKGTLKCNIEKRYKNNI